MIALEQGFETDDLAVVGEQDILGDRLVRQRKHKRRAQDVLAEASSLARAISSCTSITASAASSA